MRIEGGICEERKKNFKVFIEIFPMIGDEQFDFGNQQLNERGKVGLNGKFGEPSVLREQ